MDQSRLISVNTGLVLQTLVGQIGAAVDERLAGGEETLGGDPIPAFGADPDVARAVAWRGHLARAVERELFEPARAPAAGLADALAALRATGLDDRAAAAAHSRAVAEAEPLGRPSPDEGAFAWTVPGPGGHVRHYVALEAIAGVLGETAEGYGELKRPWTYGFCLRCCELG